MTVVRLPYAAWPRWRLTEAVYSPNLSVRAAANTERRRRRDRRS